MVQSNPVNTERTDLEVSLEVPKEGSLSWEAYLLYIQSMNNSKDAAKKIMAEVLARQDKIKFLNELKHALNSAIGTDGKLNLKGNEKLLGMLQHARELGMELPPASKLAYDVNATSRLLSQFGEFTEDLQTRNSMDFQKASSLQKETDQIILMAQSTESDIHKTKKGILQNVR